MDSRSWIIQIESEKWEFKWILLLKWKQVGLLRTFQTIGYRPRDSNIPPKKEQLLFHRLRNFLVYSSFLLLAILLSWLLLFLAKCQNDWTNCMLRSCVKHVHVFSRTIDVPISFAENESVLHFPISLSLSETVMRLVREQRHPLVTLDNREVVPKWTSCFNSWHLLQRITNTTSELVINDELEDILSHAVICIYPSRRAQRFEPDLNLKDDDAQIGTKQSSQ